MKGGNKPQKYIINDKSGVVDNIAASLKKHGKVKVTRLGIFEIKEISGRTVYNRRTGGQDPLPPFKFISFKPSKTFKKFISK